MSGCLRQRLQGSSAHVLEEVLVTLKSSFADVAASDVEVHLLGGFACEDGNTAISTVYFKGDAQRGLFSWHVLDAVKQAGFHRVNTVLLNVFEGESCESVEIEMRLREENKRFVCAALDSETGNIVTHTKHASCPIPPDWWARERRLRPGGQALVHASSPAEVGSAEAPPCPTQ